VKKGFTGILIFVFGISLWIFRLFYFFKPSARIFSIENQLVLKM